MGERTFRACSGLVAAVYLTGCGIFSGSTARGRPRDTASKKIEQTDSGSQEHRADRPSAPKKSAVELVWKIPDTAVEGFVIRYGFERDRIEHEKKVAVGELERFEDASHGYVYRYLLEQIPPDSTVFVTLAAYDGDVVSDPSPVFEVTP